MLHGLLEKLIPLFVLVAMTAGPKLQCATQTEPSVGQNLGKYQAVIQFLERLKAGRTAPRKFNVDDVPSWEPKSIAGLIALGGLTVEDVNTKVVRKYSPDEVEQALKQKKGAVFQSFSHLSFLYAKGKKQYSEVKVTEKSGVVLAALATWYELDIMYWPGNHPSGRDSSQPGGSAPRPPGFNA